MSYLRKILKKSGSPNMDRIGAQDKSRKNNVLGDFGEDLAVRLLEGMGFRIIGRNIRYKVGEIDIVAMRRDELHFVEVKTRTSDACGDPLESVTRTKMQRIRKAAEMYILKAGNNINYKDIPPCYFDVIGIDLTQGVPKIECLLDAFE